MAKLFGGKYVVLIGDLLQLPLVQKQQIFMKHKKGEYQGFQGLLWKDVFHLFELTVRQNSDSEFADKLSRVGKGKHTSADLKNWNFGRYWHFCSARKMWLLIP